MYICINESLDRGTPYLFLHQKVNQGGILRRRQRENSLELEKFLSKLIRPFSRSFLRFPENFPVFGVLTLPPDINFSVSKSREISRYPGKFPVFAVLTLLPGSEFQKPEKFVSYNQMA